MNAGLQYGLYLALLAALAWPLGKYLFKVMNGDRVLLTPVFRPIEKGIYRLLRIDENEDMGWKKYAVVCVLFNLFGFLALWAMQLLQSVLPLNPEGMPGTSWHLGFNTAASFMTNTNWQAYSGETTLSYFTQILGLCVQNFVSPAVGIAVMFALIRGLSRVRQHGVGSFYTDMVRGVVYVLMPLALVLAMVQTSQGVIQNFSGHVEYQLLEPVTASVETELSDGTTVTQEVEVTKGYIPMGPASSQIAIKQLGTNGGGYNGLNSAHPLENPTPLSNLGEMLALLLIPAACCFAFAQLFFHKQANGDLIVIDGVNYGSEHIGQQFTQMNHLWGRPMSVDTESFTDEAGNPLAYGWASNKLPASAEQEAVYAERIEAIRAAHPEMGDTPVPVDLITESGSGLDPEISPEAAEYQVKRIAANTDWTEDEVRQIIARYTTGRLLGKFGEPRVNVLKVNLALDGILKE